MFIKCMYNEVVYVEDMDVWVRLIIIQLSKFDGQTYSIYLLPYNKVILLTQIKLLTTLLMLLLVSMIGWCWSCGLMEPIRLQSDTDLTGWQWSWHWTMSAIMLHNTSSHTLPTTELYWDQLPPDNMSSNI